MSLEIWFTGSNLLARRQRNLRRRMNRAGKLRDQSDKRTAKYKAMATLHSNILDLLCSGKMGYIQSTYNEEGMFNVLERAFGVDPVSLLFAGEWDSAGPHPFNPERFLSRLRVLEDVAETLKDGDGLPVLRRIRRRLRHLPPTNPIRQAGEEAGRAVARAVGEARPSSGRLERGFSQKRHGPLLAWALKELRDFGELGTEIRKSGESPCYLVSP